MRLLGPADEGDAAVALRDQVLGGDAGRLEIVDADERHLAARHRLVDRDGRRQARLGAVAGETEGQMAGQKDQAVGLVGADEPQIMGLARRVVLGVADQDAVAALARLGLEADQDVGEVRIADIGRQDEDRPGAPHAQRPRHGVGRVAGAGQWPR